MDDRYSEDELDFKVYINSKWVKAIPLIKQAKILKL